MRKASELKFNPIRFSGYGINGSMGTKSPEEFFRSTLSQNICYCVRNTAKTVNEIADDLGVSPVYVESEVEFLEEFGFLQKRKDAYIVNFIISEPTAELLTLQDDMYRRAAEQFANELYDALTASGLLDDPALLCEQTDAANPSGALMCRDRNFLLWSLIPYIAARSGEGLMEDRISFEEVATVRPDGAHNIFHASVLPDGMLLPDGYLRMDRWCGPMWNRNGEHVLWQIDSEWSDRGEFHGTQYAEEARRVLSLYAREKKEGPLSKDEYAWLTERGYVRVLAEADGQSRAVWQIVILATREIDRKLLSIGDRIKEKYKGAFDRIKEPCAKAVLDSVPAHLRRVKEYELQFVFHSDGRFVAHCILTLLQNGKLKAPTEGQRASLTTLIVPNA